MIVQNKITYKITQQKGQQTMNAYELIIIWETGEKEIYSYATEEEAETSCREFKMIFGGQISWAGTRRVTSWNVTK